MSTEQSQHSLSLSVRNMHRCCLLPCIITLMGWYDRETSLATSAQLFRRSQHACRVHEYTCKVGFPVCAQSITIVTLKDERRDNTWIIRKYKNKHNVTRPTDQFLKHYINMQETSPSKKRTVDIVSWWEKLEWTSNFYQHINPLRAPTERITGGHSWCTA